MRIKGKQAVVVREPVKGLIRVIRGQRVILDEDLARVYAAATKQLNQAVKRNAERFPADFAFVLEPHEYAILKSQIVTSRSHGGRRKLPRAFTEHGAIMAANVLSSRRAVLMSVFVVRAFVKMREVLGQKKELAAKLTELERRLTGRLDVHEKAIVHMLGEIKKLTQPGPTAPPERSEIGFHVRKPASEQRPSARRPRRSLASESLYRAKPVGRSNDSHVAGKHDVLLYPRSNDS